MFANSACNQAVGAVADIKINTDATLVDLNPQCVSSRALAFRRTLYELPPSRSSSRTVHVSSSSQLTDSTGKDRLRY